MVCGADAVRVLAPRIYEGGDTSAHTGIGGSPSPAYLPQKGTKNKDGKRRKIMPLYALPPGIRTPPATSLRTGGTPLTSAGGKASNHPRTLTSRQFMLWFPLLYTRP